MQQKNLKRWLCCLLLLCSFATAQTQALQKAEYFFDTDPGVGNGMIVNISSAPLSIDSTFTFDVSLLTNGLHTIYIRVQDAGLHWSLNYASSFLKSSGAGGATLLTKLEYFFDTDPGVGQGIDLNLNQTNLLDSTVNFDVAGLSNGLHTIYIRAVDAGDNSSLNYSTSFLKTPGNDSLITIAKLEYFLDADPGFGNGTDIPVEQANVISDTFNFNIPDNGMNTRTLNVRALDSRGQWSLLYDTTINLCKLYQAKPNFSWVRFADEFSFIDSSKNNPTHKLLWNFGVLGIDSVSNPQFTFPQGRFSVTLTAGQGCRVNSVTLPLFVGLEKYYPDTALAGGNIIMNLYGGGLDTGVTVTLVNASGNIHPIAKISYDIKQLNAVFDLHTATPGLYNVQLHYPGGYDTTIVNGFEIKTPPGGGAPGSYDPSIDISLIGPDVARPGTTVDVQFVITNSGGMLAESIPAWLTIGKDDMGYQTDFNFSPTYIVPDTLKNVIDQVPVFQGVDSLFGKPYGGRLHNFIIPYLNAGESFIMPFTVTLPAPHGSVVDIYAWAGQRMFGSFMRNIWGSCFDGLFDFVAGFTPAACVNSLYNYAAYDIPDVYHGGSVGNFGWSTVGALVSCVPGGTLAKKLGQSQEFIQTLNFHKKSADIFLGTQSGFFNSIATCPDADDPNNNLLRKNVHKRISADPNEISGPNGFGIDNYINGKGKLGYQVSFENLPSATANAQRVYVSDTLDKNRFNLSSFELKNFIIGDTLINIPPQRKEYTTTIDLRSSQNLFVRFNAKLDTSSGVLNYSFLSLDPITRDTLRLADIRGFLPPDTDGRSGRGSVTYVVALKNDLITNDVVTNKASIVFDNNAAIITNTWLNTIDKTPSVGSVAGGIMRGDSTVKLQLAGSDVGVGVRSYRLYMSENSKPYILVGSILGDTVLFTGHIDSSYRFYATSYDSVGNFAPKTPVAEYTVAFTNPLPVTLEKFYGRKISNQNHLYFQVKQMLHVNHLVVQRSKDGRTFENIGTVPALSVKVNDLNEYIDASPLNGINYYRLKFIDDDGQYKYSGIIDLRNSTGLIVTLYPNPVKQSLQLKIDGVTASRLVVNITDVAGRSVMVKTLQVSTGNSQTSLPVFGLLPGIYFLQVKDEKGISVHNQKFIKE